MYWLSADCILCASHVVPRLRDATRGLHGHNWRVTAHVSTDRLDPAGQVLPAGRLEAELWKVLEPFDHRHLNDLDSFRGDAGAAPPTAAGLARLVAERLAAELDDERVRVRRVQVAPRAGVRASWELP